MHKSLEKFWFRYETYSLLTDTCDSEYSTVFSGRQSLNPTMITDPLTYLRELRNVIAMQNLLVSTVPGI